MTKSQKLLIASFCVSAVGLIILLVLGICTKFDLKRLNEASYEEKKYVIEDEFSKIDVETVDCDVVFELSDTVNVNITCVNPADEDTYAVENGTLKIISTRSKSDGSIFTPSFDFKDGKTDIIVAIPNRTVDSLSIKTSGGKVEISDYFNVTPGEVTLEAEAGSILYGSGATGGSITATCKTGKIELENSKCSTMTLDAGSGEITVTGASADNDVNADVKDGKLTVDGLKCGSFYVTSMSGDMSLSGIESNMYLNVDNGSGNTDIKKSDANIVNIKNNSGSVSAEFLTDKIFTTKSTSGGEITVPDPKEDLAGKCVIETKSGDVKCSIAG